MCFRAETGVRVQITITTLILFGGAKNGLKEHGVSPKEVNKDFVVEQRKIYYEKEHEIPKIN